MQAERAILLWSAVLLTALAQDVSAATLRTLHVFCPHQSGAGCTKGVDPTGPITLDQDGNLYGTTVAGGPAGGTGTVFQMWRSPENKLRYRFLYGFCKHKDCSDGSQPLGKLIVDTSGNIYGTTSVWGSGANCCRGGGEGGTVFKLTPDGVLTTLYDFCNEGGTACTDGYSPYTGLTYAGAESGVPYDGVSPLYGTTEFGGAHGGGNVFVLTPVPGASGWQRTTIYDFCAQTACADGATPTALTMDGAGDLIGATIGGGTGHEAYGTIFKLTGSGTSWSESVLHSFCLADAICSDGGLAQGPIALDGAGNIYGTTSWGGANCDFGDDESRCGVLYELDATQHYSVLHTFCALPGCADGGVPRAGVAIDHRGRLVGTTQYGGEAPNADPQRKGGGVVFRYDAGNFEVLHEFCALARCRDGAYSWSAVAIGPNGFIYGMTSGGGKPPGFGTVFRVAP